LDPIPGFGVVAHQRQIRGTVLVGKENLLPAIATLRDTVRHTRNHDPCQPSNAYYAMRNLAPSQLSALSP
jgi:hypothetical protein